MAFRADLRVRLGAAIADGAPGLPAADRLCRACVEFLSVDGAAVSIMSDGVMQGTFGSSGELSRRLDEFQFTFGEGPCMDSVRSSRPVFVDDLGDPRERRWPAYTEAVLSTGVRAVYSLPIPFASSHIGALDLYRTSPGMPDGDGLFGGVIAAELAATPLMDVIAGQAQGPNATKAAGAAVDGETDGSWDRLGPVDRLEVHQATGMLMVQLDVGPTDALARLRAHAFSHALTASETARLILARRLILAADGPGPVADLGGPR